MPESCKLSQVWEPVRSTMLPLASTKKRPLSGFMRSGPFVTAGAAGAAATFACIPPATMANPTINSAVTKTGNNFGNNSGKRKRSGAYDLLARHASWVTECVWFLPVENIREDKRLRLRRILCVIEKKDMRSPNRQNAETVQYCSKQNAVLCLYPKQTNSPIVRIAR